MRLTLVEADCRMLSLWLGIHHLYSVLSCRRADGESNIVPSVSVFSNSSSLCR